MVNSVLFAWEIGRKEREMSISGGFQNTDGLLRVGDAVENRVRDIFIVFADEEPGYAERTELGGSRLFLRADDERGNTVLIDDLHGRGFGARDRKALR